MAIQFVDVADKTTLDAVATNVSSANTDLTTLKSRGGILYNATSSKPQVYDVVNSTWVDLDVGGGGGTPTIIVITNSSMTNRDINVTFKSNPSLYSETKNAGTLSTLVFELPWLGDYVLKYTDASSNIHLAIATVIGLGGTVVDEVAQIPTFAATPDALLPTLLDLHYANSINLTTLWSVGDYHDFDDTRMVITDFDHDVLETSINGHTTAALSLHQYFIPETRRMNAANTNFGGWKDCEMRAYLNGDYFNSLSSTLRQTIKSVRRITGVGGGASSGTNTTYDKVFLLTEREIFDSKSYSFQDEWNANTQLTYYKTSSNRIKKTSASGSAYYWWESSPYSGNSAYFCGVNSSGGASYDDASNAGGLAPAYAL